MNEELRIKNHESRKRAHILHYSLFIYKGKVSTPVSAHVDI